MKRISCYISYIQIQDGSVLHSRPGEKSGYLVCNGFGSLDNWLHNISTDLLIPKERFGFTLCSYVKLSTLVKDEETEEFYNLGQEIITDRLIGLEVRQFLTANVINLDKSFEYKGFVLADLEF